MGNKYYYDGADAKKIRTVTRDAVLAVMQVALQQAGYTIGEEDGQWPLFKSGRSAETRYQRSEPFVFLAQRPTKSVHHKVLGHDDGLTHSGRKYAWTFLLQASAGKQTGETTDEQMKTADDDLMDLILDAFETRYAYFRDTLKFSDMNIAPTDEVREGGGLNPLTLTFTNITRLANDEFGYTAAP